MHIIYQENKTTSLLVQKGRLAHTCTQHPAPWGKTPTPGIFAIHSDHILVALSLIMIRILVQIETWTISGGIVVDLD